MSINSGRHQAKTQQRARPVLAGVGVSDIIDAPAGSFSPRRRETLLCGAALWGFHARKDGYFSLHPRVRPAHQGQRSNFFVAAVMASS